MTDNSTAPAPDIFRDEIDLTVEKDFYPKTREEFIEVIDEAQRNAGEFGSFEIRFSLPVGDRPRCYFKKEWDRYSLECDGTLLECEDFDGEGVAKAIENHFLHSHEN